ncbi:MAG TPA: hypothetical protein PKV41_00215 [Candidatus Omnitrophota bacterium]|nr:hypothetical protein [Candidatus Omnitrophota bacterium]
MTEVLKELAEIKTEAMEKPPHITRNIFYCARVILALPEFFVFNQG